MICNLSNYKEHKIAKAAGNYMQDKHIYINWKNAIFNFSSNTVNVVYNDVAYNDATVRIQQRIV